ncbi:hypothetical protein HanIR_Chr08g0383121 [Helianthus annuus]|nr:hypothetical protein HanIR_Chr08g0383121 [Helianthus annuus]
MVPLVHDACAFTSHLGSEDRIASVCLALFKTKAGARSQWVQTICVRIQNQSPQRGSLVCYGMIN